MPSFGATPDLVRLASDTVKRFRIAWPRSDPGSRLFWAAANVGYTVMAAAMIDKLATVDGLAELRLALRVESFDILEAASVSLAAHSAVSAVDLCAAAAWAATAQPLPAGGWEPDLNRVVCRDRIGVLLPGHAAWAVKVHSSSEWQRLWQCRSQAMHRTFRRTVNLVAGTQRIPCDDFEVGTVKVPADELVHQFNERAESWFREFCAVPLPGETPAP